MEWHKYSDFHSLKCIRSRIPAWLITRLQKNGSYSNHLTLTTHAHYHTLQHLHEKHIHPCLNRPHRDNQAGSMKGIRCWRFNGRGPEGQWKMPTIRYTDTGNHNWWSWMYTETGTESLGYGTAPQVAVSRHYHLVYVIRTFQHGRRELGVKVTGDWMRMCEQRQPSRQPPGHFPTPAHTHSLGLLMKLLVWFSNQRQFLVIYFIHVVQINCRFPPFWHSISHCVSPVCGLWTYITHSPHVYTYKIITWIFYGPSNE